MIDSAQPLKLSVVFVQYGREKYSGALEKLFVVLDRLEAVEAHVAVVDNADEGAWDHEVTDRLTHLGGDNSAWEFSAFDRGLAWFRDRRQANDRPADDLVLLVTDAYRAYGDDFLDLWTDEAFRLAAHHPVTIGWIDSLLRPLELLGHGYRDFVRSSFVLGSPTVFDRVAPLAYPLDPAAFFSEDPAHPFRRDAPMSEDLKDFLIAWLTGRQGKVRFEQRWHSRFDLDARSFEFFRRKVLAILREQLLSARLQAAGIPCLDLRMVAELEERVGSPHRLDLDAFTRHAWLRWMDRPGTVRPTPRWYVDGCNLPAQIAQGERFDLEVAGWVGAEPRPDHVELHLGERRWIARCEEARPDVVTAHPELEGRAGGFRFSVAADGFEPGLHRATLVLPSLDHREPLGSLEITPRCELRIDRLFVAAARPAGSPLPIAVDIGYLGSSPLESVRVCLDGIDLEDTLSIVCQDDPTAGGDRLHAMRIEARGSVAVARDAAWHRLEIEARSVAGERAGWADDLPVRLRDTLPHTLSCRKIGRRHPRTLDVPVHLAGVVGGVAPGDRLVLTAGGRTLLSELLQVEDAPGATAFFDVRRSVGGFSVGAHQVELAVLSSNGTRHRLLDWEQQVRPLEPILHLSTAEARPRDDRDGSYLLRLVGWVENDFLVDALSVTVGEQFLGAFGVDQLPPTDAMSGPTVLRQGFALDLPIESEGSETWLHLEANQRDGPSATLGRSLNLPASPRRALLLDGENLDRLRRADHEPLRFYGRLELQARVVRSVYPELVATLEVDGREVDRQVLSVGDGMRLRARALEAGERSASTSNVRLRVEAYGRVLFDSGERPVEVLPVARPTNRLAADFDVVRSALLPSHHPLLDEPADRLLDRLLRDRLHEASDVRDAVRSLAAQVRAPRPSVFETLEPATTDRPLSILFASWEVPCLRHGGGVYLTNLLKRLGRRHHVTVVHAESPHERGWNDDIRPLVDRIIAVPRRHDPDGLPEHAAIPRTFSENWTPALRQALEAEIARGSYDLVDYEYLTMWRHRPRLTAGDGPAEIQAILELPVLARRLAWDDDALAAPWPDRLARLWGDLQAAYASAVALPRDVRRLVLVTPEDAAALAELAPSDCELHVDTLPVDL
ncbi:MAG: hypothetical protein AAGN46_17175, partial [Acidobacteriota bacterium]